MISVEKNESDALVPGDPMPDGTIFAGISPYTQKPMYTTPNDEPLRMTYSRAVHSRRDAHGHKDWRIPSLAELRVLFDNRAAIGGLSAGRYWSSDFYNDSTVANKRFNDGKEFWNYEDFRKFSVRYVRGEIVLPKAWEEAKLLLSRTMSP